MSDSRFRRQDAERLRILLVAHYASESLGGEALIPVQLFRQLSRLGHDAWLVTHESGRERLTKELSADDRIVYTSSLPGCSPFFDLGERLPAAPRQAAWAVTQIERQLAMAPTVRRLVDELGIDVVHQPISVSPSIPSPIHKLPVPVVMGPLNGGMDLPPGFRDRDSSFGRFRKRSRPALGRVLNRTMPGRVKADAILVANERTRSRLPRETRGIVRRISDIGVDLDQMAEPNSTGDGRSDGVEILFAGRLVGWKGVDLLIDAFAEARARVTEDVPVRLRIVGDGPCSDALRGQVRALRLGRSVVFDGWLSRADVEHRMRSCDVFVLPSLEEAGGAVLLEAMACARPVIAANWGGPADIVDDSCGVRVDPQNRVRYINGLADAIVRLSLDPQLRSRMGTAGRSRVESSYDWKRIAAAVVSVYGEVLDGRNA